MASINKKFTVKNGLRSETGDVLIEDGGVLALSNTSDANSIVMNAQTAVIAIGGDANTAWQLPVDRGANNGYFLQINSATGAADWAEVPSGAFTISDGTNTDTFINGQTLTFTGTDGIDVTVSNNAIEIDLANTAVTAGSYGSTTEIPVITVDGQGRLTAANTVSISTSLDISDGTVTDSVSLASDTLTFTGGTALTSAVTDNVVTFNLDNTAVTANTYGAADTVATFTVDAQGRLTAAGDVTISITKSQISDLGAVLYNVVEDTTPQLGGNLDLNSSDITGTGNIDITGDITASGKLVVGDTSNTGATSVIEGGGTIWIDPTPVAGNTSGLVIIKGDFQVDGTTTTVNSTTITIDDKNIELASGAANNSVADGAGLTVAGANATFTYDGANDRWTANKSIAANLVGNVTGNADTATALETARTIELTGDVTGSASFDGTANASIAVTIGANSVALGTDTTGDYVESLSGSNGIVVTGGTGESSTPTVTTANTVTLGTTDTALRGHKQASINAATQYQVETQTGVIGSKVVFGAVDASDATSRHMIEVMVLTDGTDTHITQYGEVFTSASLFTLTGGSTAGDITITPAAGKTINIKVVEQTI